MYASSAFMASLLTSMTSPSLGFSMHQLTMSRRVANSLICSWNFGNSWGWMSDEMGWHIAQAIPVLDRFTPSSSCAAASPWNSLSPMITCSMKRSWNAFRVSAS